jgi:hypothetical protein
MVIHSSSPQSSLGTLPLHPHRELSCSRCTHDLELAIQWPSPHSDQSRFTQYMFTQGESMMLLLLEVRGTERTLWAAVATDSHMEGDRRSGRYHTLKTPPEPSDPAPNCTIL